MSTGRAGSSPAIRTRKNLVISMVTRFFLAHFQEFPLFFPLFSSGRSFGLHQVDELVHLIGALLPHLLDYISILIQSEGYRGMT